MKLKTWILNINLMKYSVMEDDIRKMTEEEIVRLDILNKIGGAYCKKENEDGNIIQYAYISSNLSTLVVFMSGDASNACIYNLNKNEAESQKTIGPFLVELTFRPLFLKGKPYEQKMAKEMWQLCIPQSQIPDSIKNYINNFINTNSK